MRIYKLYWLKYVKAFSGCNVLLIVLLNGIKGEFITSLYNLLWPLYGPDCNSSYLEGYVFIENSSILGYAMLAKSFSTEFGKPCIWFEDLYLKPKYRRKGIVTNFIYHIKENYKNHVFKLEVEDYNEHALHIYKKCGFEKLPYSEMILKNY